MAHRYLDGPPATLIESCEYVLVCTVPTPIQFRSDPERTQDAEGFVVTFVDAG